VIGAGFGGLFATRRLTRAPVEVTVIDRTTHHLFSPLLYQVAPGILSQGEGAILSQGEGARPNPRHPPPLAQRERRPNGLTETKSPDARTA
jgi:choline dehydrogenase-like flavoprotein